MKVKTLALDSSVIVKWFKKGEESEEEAQKLKQGLLSSAFGAFSSELLNLEVCRGLVKARYPTKKVQEAYAILHEMNELGFIESVPTAMLHEVGKELVIELKLYVADAITLAVARSKSVDLLTEDKHLLKQDAKKMMKGNGLKVITLKEFYGQTNSL